MASPQNVSLDQAQTQDVWPLGLWRSSTYCAAAQLTSEHDCALESGIRLSHGLAALHYEVQNELTATA